MAGGVVCRRRQRGGWRCRARHTTCTTAGASGGGCGVGRPPARCVTGTLGPCLGRAARRGRYRPWRWVPPPPAQLRRRRRRLRRSRRHRLWMALAERKSWSWMRWWWWARRAGRARCSGTHRSTGGGQVEGLIRGVRGQPPPWRLRCSRRWRWHGVATGRAHPNGEGGGTPSTHSRCPTCRRWWGCPRPPARHYHLDHHRHRCHRHPHALPRPRPYRCLIGRR